MKQFKYDAFISYRHCPLDQFVAENLHRKLERFRLPNNVIKNQSKCVRIDRVFRDLDELPITNNLSDPITTALNNSKFLIIICSPRLKESLWCTRELEIFLQSHERSHVLLVLAEGEPSDSFPEILTYEDVLQNQPDGSQNIARKKIEPLAADVRGDSKRAILKAMDNAVIRLAAAIFNVNYDDIKQRHREQQLRTKIIWASCISFVLLVFSMVCLFLYAKINVQNHQLEIAHAKSLANFAENLIAKGRRMDALYSLRSVMKDDEYLSSESYRIMMSALDPYSLGTSYIASNMLNSNAPVTDFDVNFSGNLIAVTDRDEKLKVFEIKNHAVYSPNLVAEVNVVNALNNLPYFGFSDDKTLIYSDEYSIKQLDLQSKKITNISSKPGFVLVPRDLLDYVTVVLSGKKIEGYHGSEIKFSISLEEIGLDISSFSNLSFGFSADGNFLALYLSNWSGQTYLLHINTEVGVLELVDRLTVNGRFDITTDGNRIFALSHIEKYPDGKRKNNLIYAIDAKTGEYVWKKPIPTMSARDINLVNDQLLITGLDGAVLLDKDNLSVVAHSERTGDVLNAINFKNEVYVSYFDGHLYLMNGIYSSGIDVTLNLFRNEPDHRVQKVLAAGERLFYMYSNTKNIIVYENNPFTEYNGRFVCLGDRSSVDPANCSVPEGTGFEYLNPNLKYFFVENLDKSRNMTDYELGRLQVLIDRYRINRVHSVVYVLESNIYIVQGLSVAYIMDGSFNEIDSIKNVKIESFINGRMILSYNGNRYSIQYLSPKQIIKYVDEILGDYEPDQQLMEIIGIEIF